jgi:hypothetical protein
MGGAGTLTAGGDGTTSITWTYTAPSAPTYTVRLTVTGTDGVTTDFAEVSVTVPGV